MHTVNLGGKAYFIKVDYETTLQKQPFSDVFQNRYSYEFRNILRKITVLESFLVKLQATLLKRESGTGVFL